MCKLLSVTNRKLCTEPFPTRLRRLAESGVDGIILREKDLPAGDYRTLAAQAMEICTGAGIPCILHSYGAIAAELGCKSLHLPLPRLREMTAEQRACFSRLGASCHSLADVTEAAALGCTYVTLGHIFPTACKPGLPPRGVELLREVCAASPIPVYAIGGISAENLPIVRTAGAAGACLMSSLMTCPDPKQTISALRQTLG